MANDSTEIFGKLPKLDGKREFILRRRRFKAFIQCEDFGLTELQERSKNGTSETLRWKKAMTQAKAAIILTLDNSPIALTNSIIEDDNKTAKNLREALEALYRVKSAGSA